jgi:hypothetical protein
VLHLFITLIHTHTHTCARLLSDVYNLNTQKERHTKEEQNLVCPSNHPSIRGINKRAPYARKTRHKREQTMISAVRSFAHAITTHTEKREKREKIIIVSASTRMCKHIIMKMKNKRGCIFTAASRLSLFAFILLLLFYYFSRSRSAPSIRVSA